MSYVRIEKPQPHTTVIRMDRPERMNSMSFDLVVPLHDALDEVALENDTWCVILTGTGRGFCAGADTRDMEPPPNIEGLSLTRIATKAMTILSDLVPKMRRMPQPVIAAINGHAVGVGLTLAMQCDLRLVASDAKLAFAFVRRGIIPELGSHSILPRVIGFSRAADLLLSGRTIRGEEAAALGLASEALPAEAVVPRAQEWARDVAVNAAPASVAIAKRLLWEGVTETPLQTMAKEKTLLAWVGKQADAAEGVRSFLERRPPEWKLRASTDLPQWPED